MSCDSVVVTVVVTLLLWQCCDIVVTLLWQCCDSVIVTVLL